MENIYQDMAARTGGNIYIGVVGPVRTGKSTLVKRIMEQLVIPGIQDPYQAQRARDELPQSGSGKTIMTSEPKFVPEEAVEISPDGTAKLRVRMIDSVGYMVEGASGVQEDGTPRMVTTPWVDHEIPMTEAAELGTRKVMEEHCSIGLVVTTDGTVTDIPREAYLEAERRAITDMQATGKPYLVLLNSAQPDGEAAAHAAEYITGTYGIPVTALDCQSMEVPEICAILRDLLYAFPMQQLQIFMPRWMNALEHPVKTQLYQNLLQQAEKITALSQAESCLQTLADSEVLSAVRVSGVDLGSGTVSCTLSFPESLFYQVLSQQTGMEIRDDTQLLSQLTELAAIRQEYSQISDALSSVRATGYGIVMPSAREMTLKKPELLRKGSSCGVRLQAGAPSIHMIRVDIDTEINPMVGDEKQSQDLIAYLQGESPEKLWQSNIFGKSVYALIQEGLSAKLLGMPEEVRSKFRGTLTRIVNEGAKGLVCLIL